MPPVLVALMFHYSWEQLLVQGRASRWRFLFSQVVMVASWLWLDRLLHSNFYNQGNSINMAPVLMQAYPWPSDVPLPFELLSPIRYLDFSVREGHDLMQVDLLVCGVIVSRFLMF
jgi:hypothetical protein